MTGPGMERITAPNFGEKPSRIETTAATTNSRGRIDLRRRHHTDIFGVSRDASATTKGGNNRGETVSQKRAAQEAVEASARHHADGFDMAKGSRQRE